MILTREQAINLHREMWNWIADEEEKCTITTRWELKVKFCEDHFPEEKILNWCFLCEYSSLFSHNVGPDCIMCPAIWGSEELTDGFYCEYGYPALHHTNSSARAIANIKMKDE